MYCDYKVWEEVMDVKWAFQWLDIFMLILYGIVDLVVFVLVVEVLKEGKIDVWLYLIEGVDYVFGGQYLFEKDVLFVYSWELVE